MVKSSSRPRKACKFTIDLGPEIDKVVKKKLHTRDVKIKRQKVIILGLKKERDELRTRSSEVNDLKMKKQKTYVSNLQVMVNDLTKKLNEAEKRVTEVQSIKRKYEVTRTGISNKTVEYAFNRLRDGFSLSKMKPNTRLLIQQSGRWEEARLISARFKVC
mgnify:CR=1 FL=1|tara:strand:- start:781 stop:1260 length:480 start_codon:yes stop_codon:yes gene_type:complete